MASVLRFRKLYFLEPNLRSNGSSETIKGNKPSLEGLKVDYKHVKSQGMEELHKNMKKKWRCLDSCCWFIGCVCTTWWLLLFLYHCLPANLAPDPPGVRLKNEGLVPLHPVVMVPGMVTGVLELWEGRPCSEGLFRKRLWGGSFTEIFKRFDQLYNWFSCCIMLESFH